MLLILGLVMLIFGADWVVFGIRARSLGGVLVVLGLAEGYLYVSRARAEYRRVAIENARLRAEAEPELARHVALHPDGKGATFYLRREAGRPRWNWAFDRGIGGDLMSAPGDHMAVDKAIDRMEQRLGIASEGRKPPWATEPPREQLPGWPWEDSDED